MYVLAFWQVTLTNEYEWMNEISSRRSYDSQPFVFASNNFNDTNRPSSSVSPHITVDLYRTSSFPFADVHSVNTVWRWTWKDVRTVAWFVCSEQKQAISHFCLFFAKYQTFLQGVSIACYADPRNSYDRSSSRLLRDDTLSKRRRLGSRNVYRRPHEGICSQYLWSLFTNSTAFNRIENVKRETGISGGYRG